MRGMLPSGKGIGLAEASIFSVKQEARLSAEGARGARKGGCWR